MSQQTRNAAAFARLVAALNAVDTKAAAAFAAAGSAAQIDDAATANNKTWSSTKIQTQITAAITALINGAPGAQDTLAELAAQITGLTQADAGLLSFAVAQALTAPQQLQACTNLGIGDPDHNYVTAIDAALNAGL